MNRILPRRVDNSYLGHKLALWLFGVLVFMKTSIGLGTIFNGREAATSADGIPLDSFGAAGAQAFMSMFAAWGLAQATLGLLSIVVLVRYRALVPFMFALLLLEHLCRKAIFAVMPIDRTADAPGSFINLALVGLMVMGLALSLWKPDGRRANGKSGGRSATMPASVGSTDPDR